MEQNAYLYTDGRASDKGETKLTRTRETETEYKQLLVYSNNMKTDITEKKYNSY